MAWAKRPIDIPGESAGYEGPSTQSHIGSALDESFGNYDEYTVLQLAQYMSTIANGGYRMKPYVVSQIRGLSPTGAWGRLSTPLSHRSNK